MKFKTFLFGVLTLSFLPLLTLSGYASERKPLIVVGDANFPPVEYIEDGRVKGFNTEIWQELSKAMNRPVEIRLMLWKDAQQKVLNGEADALTLLGRTEKREKLYDFSEPTLTFEFCFFVRSDDPPIETINDLKGKIIGVTKGGYAREGLEPNKDIKLLFIKDNLEGFRLLTSRKIDAVGTDKWVGAYTIQKHQIKGINIVEKPFAKSIASIPVKKGNLKLLNEINNGIKKLKKEKAIQKILDKWSPKEVVFLTKERINRIITIVVTAFLIAVIVFSLLWIVLLKRQVNTKTKKLGQEIQEHKRAEEALRHSQHMLQTVLDSTPAGIFWKDRDSIYLGGNRTWLETVGLKSSEEVVGKSDYDLTWGKKQADSFREDDRRVMESGIPEYDIIEPYLQADGTHAWAKTNKVPLQDTEGNVVGVLGTYEDITERKQAEGALRESEEKYRSLVESTEDYIYLVDRNCAYMFMNKEYLSKFGMSEDKVIGRRYDEFHSKDETKEFRGRVNAVIKTGKSSRYVYESERVGGHYLQTLSPVKALKGNIVAVTVVSKDITELKRAEGELRQANEELSREQNQRRILSKRLIDLLEKDRRQVAMELHDQIGQILTSLKMDIEMIHGKLKPEHGELVARITAAQERTIQAIKDVKNISRGLRPGMLDALGLVPSLRELFNEIQRQTDIEIRFFSRNIPKRLAPEKELAIYRIAQEALTNIIRHAKAKNVFVNLVKKDENLSLSAEDDGVGFDQDKVLTFSKKKGPLGILIMRERAEQLDGDFTLESQIGKGTHLLVEIPI